VFLKQLFSSLWLVHTGVEVDSLSPSTFRRQRLFVDFDNASDVDATLDHYDTNFIFLLFSIDRRKPIFKRDARQLRFYIGLVRHSTVAMVNTEHCEERGAKKILQVDLLLLIDCVHELIKN